MSATKIDNAEWNAFAGEMRDLASERLAEIVGRTTKLGDIGNGQLRGFSPLRDDGKTPSFYVYPDGRWYDFGTSSGGDLFKFLELRDRVSFREALDVVAREVGRPTWDERKKARGASADPEELAAILEATSERRDVLSNISAIVHLCHAALPQRVRKHLNVHYGLSDDFIDMEKIGWVPAGLYEHCREVLGLDEKTLLKTGFFLKLAEPTPTASQRILFPYWQGGFCVYTIAREYLAGVPRSEVTIPDHDKAKYKKHLVHNDRHPYVSKTISNSNFWGEDSVRFARGKTLLICEGVTDAMIAAQLGFPVVSPVTVSFRDQDLPHAVDIGRRVGEIVILNDEDVLASGRRPGLEGALKMAAKLHAEGVVVRIGHLPKGEGVAKVDINEICRDALAAGGEDGARAELQGIIDRAKGYLPFLVSEIPPDAAASEVEKRVGVLGAAAWKLSPLRRVELADTLLARLPSRPKGPLRKLLNDAIAAEQLRQKSAKDDAEVDEAGGKKRREVDVSKITPIRRSVREDLGFYEVESADGGSDRISTFTLSLRRTVVQKDGPLLLCCDVVGLGATLARDWTIPRGAWGSKRSFIASFPSEGMQWFGADDDVQAVYEMLTRGGVSHVPRVESAKALGHHVLRGGAHRFVLMSGTVEAAGWMAEPDVVYLADGGSNLQDRLVRAPGAFDDAGALACARTFLEHALSLHAPRTIVPLLGWFSASVFRDRIFDRYGAFALLNVTGTAGSGKTSLVAKILWPAFAGVTKREALGITASLFALTRDFSSSTSIPLVFDEYKPADMGKATDVVHRMLRRLYAGETETRGRADQGVNTYVLCSPVVVMGETKIKDDAALAERCLFVIFDRNHIDREPRAREAFRLLYGLPLHTIAPLLQRWSLGVDLEAIFARAETAVDSLLARLVAAVPQRVRANLVTMTIGLYALDAFAASVGTALPAYDYDRVCAVMLAEIFGEDAVGDVGDIVRGGAGRVRDAYDDFVCDAAAMANVGLLEEGVHFAWVGGTLRLPVALIDQAREVWKRSRGVPNSSPGVGELRRIAREKVAAGCAYIGAVQQRVRLGGEAGGQLRADVILADKIPEHLGVDDFPRDAERRWGGDRSDKNPWSVASARAGYTPDPSKGTTGGGELN